MEAQPVAGTQAPPPVQPCHRRPFRMPSWYPILALVLRTLLAALDGLAMPPPKNGAKKP